MGVSESADQDTIRKAYIELVKRFHPDSDQAGASEKRFLEIDEAFKVLQQKFAKSRRGIEEDVNEEVPDIQHTAPQHRQYLNYEGLGIGNPFQREKQYQQIKAMKAQNKVLQHRLEKAQADEKTLWNKNSKQPNYARKHDIKTKYGLERLVEDYIQEAMSKGDFDNLKGCGKPLPSSQNQNPYLDFTTHKLNKILLDNGFTPEWITLQREIREDLNKLKSELKEKRSVLPAQLNVNDDSPEAREWSHILQEYKPEISRINKNIDKYNLIVPIFDHQFFRINLKKLSEEILRDSSIKLKPSQLSKNTQVDLKNKEAQSLFTLFGSFFNKTNS